MTAFPSYRQKGCEFGWEDLGGALNRTYSMEKLSPIKGKWKLLVLNPRFAVYFSLKLCSVLNKTIVKLLCL